MLFRPSITSRSPPMDRKSFALSTWERADPCQHGTAAGLETQFSSSSGAPCFRKSIISPALPISSALCFKSNARKTEQSWRLVHATLPVSDGRHACADRWLLSNAEALLTLGSAIQTSLSTCFGVQETWPWQKKKFSARSPERPLLEPRESSVLQTQLIN